MQLNPEERAHLAGMVLRTLDTLGVDPAAQIRLLGLGETVKPRHLARYRNGTALPDDPLVHERCQHVLRIHHALELVFAHNPALIPAWLGDPGNRRFGRAPLEVMLDGDAGLREVSRMLEGHSDWE